MIEPLKFHPIFKTVIWGGDKICQYKGIAQPEPNIGESWEIAQLPGHESVVSEGPYEGLTITELIERFGVELLGKRVIDRYGKKFPMLVKLIDAADNLSIQVHPDDSIARTRHNSLGKSEMWYIIQADKDAKIFSGLNLEMTPEEYASRVEQGNFAETLASHLSVPGDVFYLPAGRVHTIGAGNLLAEIQESSDITYRIYDYNRLDASGKARELHTDLAKEAIDFKVYDTYKSPTPSPLEKDAEIVKCDHFTVRRILLEGELILELPSDSFSVLMCVEGKCDIIHPSATTKLAQGETALLPASQTTLTLRGTATLLLSYP